MYVCISIKNYFTSFIVMVNDLFHIKNCIIFVFAAADFLLSDNCLVYWGLFPICCCYLSIHDFLFHLREAIQNFVVPVCMLTMTLILILILILMSL